MSPSDWDQVPDLPRRIAESDEIPTAIAKHPEYGWVVTWTAGQGPGISYIEKDPTGKVWEECAPPGQNPTLHYPVPIGMRVVCPKEYGGGDGFRVEGRVIGIALAYVVYHYIVLLDRTLSTPFGEVKAISVPGTHLEKDNGYNWRLKD